MLDDIKKMQGICNNEFDNLIKGFINSCESDLKSIGILESKINSKDPLINTAITSYVLSQIDVKNSEMYSNSYILQKDYLRHLSEYTTEVK